MRFAVDRFTEGGKNIAFANNTPTWKLHRKIAGKALRQYMIGNHFEAVLHESMNKCLPLMLKETGVFNPENYIDLMVFNILNAVCFGKSVYLDDPEFKFNEHDNTFNSDKIRDFTDSLILARKEAEREENEEVLSQLTNTHLRQTLMDIFNAGIDTSRITLFFAVRYMAGLPDIQSKVQEEIDRVVGKDRLPTVKDKKISALQNHFEVMYDVPQDTVVMINHWALHRDPKYWKDVEKFDPTRYLDENGKLGMKPESWLPFSAGRRVSLGEVVAKPELHLIFATIMQRFKITLPEGTNSELKLGGSSSNTQPAPFQIIVEDRINT
ncbi:steroid 17-alpha-hydroxylase/17,20 lyase-like [Mytilus galloprovincialis]|uniref:steroid 17-alpha-hydroxylase/17,20 lyase-like n=1 Tax=Mytilus galloprovincialis TaxID=29158 RepID=UPI003F7C2625